MTDPVNIGWWVLAGLLVTAELWTGTVYLLLLALGAAAAGMASWLGAPVALQVISAALVGGGTTALWHVRRARHPTSPPAGSNPDVLLDIGQQVTVSEWHADGTARVSHRGSAWSARQVSQGTTPPAVGLHRIVAIEGNVLLVEPLR